MRVKRFWKRWRRGLGFVGGVFCAEWGGEGGVSFAGVELGVSG